MCEANEMSHLGVIALMSRVSIIDITASRKLSSCPGGVSKEESEAHGIERPKLAEESIRRVACVG